MAAIVAALRADPECMSILRAAVRRSLDDNDPFPESHTRSAQRRRRDESYSLV